MTDSAAAGLRLGQVVAEIERLYPAASAASWDAVGLVCGDPDDTVASILFALDPTEAVVDEALEWGADLLVTHHPLLLRAVNGVPSSTAKGRTVHRLIRGGCALVVAHTNADVASPGVSDALARTIGLRDLRPLAAQAVSALDKVVVFVPDADAERLVDALSAAGAGALGDYARCAFTSTGSGTFLPGQGARPAVGSVGVVEVVAETRVEMVLPRRRREAVVRALRAAHPYEEPAFDLLELVDDPATPTGTGRVGDLAAAVTLERLAQYVAEVLPATEQGVRVAGDPAAMVRRVAVCGGAGDDLFDEVRASGADVYLTSDLRHHPASEAREHARGGPPYLIDVAHWASEWPWLAGGASRLESALAARPEGAGTVALRVSTTRTDPWTMHVPSKGSTPVAATTDQWRLLDVQALDTRLNQIAHRRRTLPEHAELAALEQRSAALYDELVGAQTQAGDVARELTKAEGDVELVRQRSARDQARLQAGQGGHKELESLQHEVATLARRQAALEDVELEIMERHEVLTATVERLEGERDGLQAQLADVTARRDRAVGLLDDEAAQLTSQRVGMVAGLDGPLVALYEKIRAGGGSGAAKLWQRRCEGCRMELNPQDLQRIRAAADDDVVRCEECGGILVRTGESGL